jgi:hypothetical protein
MVSNSTLLLFGALLDADDIDVPVDSNTDDDAAKLPEWVLRGACRRSTRSPENSGAWWWIATYLVPDEVLRLIC